MEQRCFEFTNPVSHSQDPDTSHHAAADVTKSGKRATHAKIVLGHVEKYPGLTSTELATLIGLPLYAVRRRLSDLHHKDLVRQGEPVSRGGERSQVTWWRKQ